MNRKPVSPIFRKGNVFLFLTILAMATSAWAEPRTYTNREGKTIEAEIVSVREGNVYLKQGGRNLVVVFDQLSDPDQEFVRDWAKKNFVYNLTFQAVETELKEQRQADRPEKTETANNSSESEAWKFDIKITNRSGVDINNLKVEYLVMARASTVLDPGLGKKSKKEEGNPVKGTVMVPRIGNTGTAQFSTNPLTLRKVENATRRSRNYVDADRQVRVEYYWDKAEYSEKLDGIWIRVFLEDRMIAEWKSQGKLIKEVDWDAPPVRAGGPGFPGIPGFIPR